MAPISCADEAAKPVRAQRGKGLAVSAIPFYFAFASAVSIVVSIAASQILLGAGLVALFVLKMPLRFPPVKLPLLLFFCATLLSDLLSGDPIHGVPQLRKFYVFAIMLLVFSTFRTISRVRWLFLGWAVIAGLSSLRGFTQFLARHQDALRLHANTYGYLLDDRITGFASHWMTFGGEEMIVLLTLLSFLLFGARWRLAWAGWILAAVIWAGIVLSLTRSIFLLGAPAGVVYLAWNYKRWLVLALPALAALMFLAAPFQVKERVDSLLNPHGDVDSNSRHLLMMRTGLRMIEAHPWFGLGPEQIAPQFERYVPAGVPRPLPRGWYGHLHNIYLQYAAERGIPALLFILWMIARMLRDFVRAIRGQSGEPGARFALYAAVAVIVSILAEGIFEHNLGDSEVLTMFLIVVTCGHIAAQPAPSLETADL